MTRMQRDADGRIPLRWWVWGAVVLVPMVVAAWPWAFYLTHLQVPLALAVGVLGWLPRRRLTEGLWLGLPILAAHGIDERAGAWAMACLVLAAYALTRRPRFSSLAGASVFGVLIAAVHLKYRFAGSRLTWHDVRFFFAQFADNVGVMASQPTLLAYALLVVLGLAVLLYAGWRVDGRRPPLGRTGTYRAACAVAGAVALCGWTGTQLFDEAREQARLRGPWHMAESREATALPVARFLAAAFLAPSWQPGDVDTRAFVAAAHRRQSAAGPAAAPADIVLFLQESQFNPATWKDCPAALCRLPVFEGGPGTIAFGPMRVHTFGGGTWLSEFTLATGVPHDAFGPGGTFAPFNIAPGTHRSFLRSLKAAGYRTVAVYPVRGGMMNARMAYHAYGFDAFHDASDLGLSGTYFTSDADMHAAALKVLEQERRHGRPVLLLTVTIANHAEHGTRMESVPPELLARARTAFPAGREADNVADYVWRTMQFQHAYAATRQALLAGPRPAVVAWFGDHQPPFGSALPLRDRIEAADVPGNRIPPAFQTWYQVSSNVPGRSGSASKGTPLDLAFLPGLLAQAAGVPADTWLAANETAREECAGLLTECIRPEVREAYLAYLLRDLKAIELP